MTTQNKGLDHVPEAAVEAAARAMYEQVVGGPWAGTDAEAYLARMEPARAALAAALPYLAVKPGAHPLSPADPLGLDHPERTTP